MQIKDKIIIYIKNIKSLDPETTNYLLDFLGCFDKQFIDIALRNLASYTKIRRLKDDILIYFLISDKFPVSFFKSHNMKIISYNNNRKEYEDLHLNGKLFKHLKENKTLTSVLTKSQFNILKKIAKSDKRNCKKIAIVEPKQKQPTTEPTQKIEFIENINIYLKNADGSILLRPLTCKLCRNFVYPDKNHKCPPFEFR